MNRITYLIIFFVLLAVGCTNDGRTNKSLVEIDSLLGKGMVDSAYNCLQAIPQKDLRTTDDSAYYYLLDTLIIVGRSKLVTVLSTFGIYTNGEFYVLRRFYRLV